VERERWLLSYLKHLPEEKRSGNISEASEFYEMKRQYTIVPEANIKANHIHSIKVF
jgi:hypothetical protein